MLQILLKLWLIGNRTSCCPIRTVNRTPESLVWLHTELDSIQSCYYYKLSHSYTLFQSKLLENHTLHNGTYLYSPYMAVPPGVYHLPPFKLIAVSFKSAAFESQIKPQGPEEICLFLETKMGYFDQVAVSLHF